MQNWFQNRRAKVKQDAKKAINAQNMFMQQQMAQQMHSGGIPMHHADFFQGQPHPEQAAYGIDAAHQNFCMPTGQPMMGGVDSMPAHQPALDLGFHPNQDLAFEHYNMTNIQDFGAMYGDMGNVEGMDLPFIPGAPMQVTQSNGSTPSIPSTLSSMPSHSTMPSSVGGMNVSAMHMGEWADDSKPAIYFSEASDCQVGPQTAYCSPPEDTNTARWVSQQPHFDHTSSPESVERPESSQNLPPTPPDNQLSIEDLPHPAFSRRPSSTGLSEPLGDVDIHTPTMSNDDGFKQPGEPSTLAARRQRPRPAALGQAALRSASYSAGMPASPGANANNLCAPEQQLRRIRSSGVPGTQPARVQKQAAPGQRSPLHMNFADAAESPKFARHAATWAMTHSPAAHSLAPPTPLTPHDGSRFPSWQSLGSVNSHHNSVDQSSPNGIALSWTADSPAMLQPHSVSSPPDTPLDAAQVTQYHDWLHATEGRRHTPPQSAPAFQHSFHPAGFNFTVESASQDPSVSYAGHIGHTRKSSMPEQSTTVVAHAPLYHATAGEVPIEYQGMPIDQMQAHRLHPHPFATVPSQTAQNFPTPPQPTPAGLPGQNNMLSADFAVHEYLPPGAQSRARNSASPAAVAEPNGPKMFHFSNTGPKDFKS
ncbi:MAG: hypothetical protein INR71_01200 [Terriglobus roseus]|nr:hypothetical protein [Terriglobus roseus]